MAEKPELLPLDDPSQADLIFNQLNDAIFIVDQAGIILSVNQSACKLTGYEKTEIIGKPVGVFILGHPAPHSVDLHPVDLFSSMAHSPHKVMTDFLTKNGQKIPIEITHVHLSIEHGNISYIIVKSYSDQKIAETLREISSTLSSSLNLEDVLDNLLVELRKIIPYDGGSVLIVNSKTIHVTRSLGYDRFGENFTDLVNSLSFNISTTENLNLVLKHRQPLIIEDTRQVSYWHRDEISSLFCSWIGVPILIDEKVEAIISLDKVEANFFTEEHAAILNIFSNQAASSIKNARLYEVETRRIQQLDGLQSTLVAINSQLELKTLLKEIVKRAIRLLNASTGELALYDADLDKLRILVSINAKKDFTRQLHDIGKGVMGTVAASKKPIKIDRFTEDSEIPSDLKFLGSHSGLTVPLLVGKELLGVLGIADLRSNRVFEEADIALLNTFAQQATIAIKNSRLYEDAKHRAEAAETMRKIGSVITSSLDQNQAVNLILDQLAQIIPYDSAIVILQNNGYLQVVGSHGKVNLAPILDQKIDFSGNNPPAEVFIKKKPILIRDATHVYSLYNKNHLKVQEINSWLGAPLIIQDQVIGILSLGSEEINHFTNEHLRLITVLADQMAIALENARLYTEASRSAKRFQTLYRLSQIISSNLRSEDIYPAIHQAVSELMAADFFSIALFDSRTQLIQDAYMVDRGKHLALSTHPLDKGLTSTVLRKGKSLLFNTYNVSIAKEVGSVVHSNLPETEMPQSILVVPLSIGSNRIGVLSAQSYRPNMYASADQEILELLAANVAIAVENGRLFDEVQQLAITDPLTKLNNRRKFEEISIKEFKRSRRYHRPMCLIMIDLDQFKEVNDEHGHIAGDQVLSGLASLCRNNLRDVDLLARYGGEEFMILLPETDAVKAMATAERLRQDCATTEFHSKKGDISLTISQGVVKLDDTCKDLEELIDRADQALYASKHAGRNTCTLWTPELAQTTPQGDHTANN
jgi:diguanylate cyclase (GGDEF)-like protein/PAS domain S-box-containing protein